MSRLLLCATISLTLSCTAVVVSSSGKTTPSGKVPPGQMKTTGSKSAKPYAPGQQKKK